jgi:hypothetical protein
MQHLSTSNCTTVVAVHRHQFLGYKKYTKKQLFLCLLYSCKALLLLESNDGYGNNF